jgi:type IV fimbrial biogenesis protein FimT
MTHARGYTLLECLIAMAIVALLFGIALPAMSGGLEAARAVDTRSELLASLTEASTHAALTGQHAVLCPSLDGVQCADSEDWSAGWIVFIDPNADRHHDPDERLLHQQGPLAGKVHLRSTVGRTKIVFQGNGGNAGSNVSFTLCDGRGPAKAVSLVISNAGRLREGVPTEAAIAATCAD